MMNLLFDIGNTHTHVGLASAKKVSKDFVFPTCEWKEPSTTQLILEFVGTRTLNNVAFASVSPKADRHVKKLASKVFKIPHIQLTSETLEGTGIQVDYPNPASIGADRLANAIAARSLYPGPVVVVDFGTAVTFDVVNKESQYVGGIITPGLSAMTEYLHEKTALLPRIEIKDTKRVIGKSTTEAMLIGAVHGYRGMIRELITELRQELKSKVLPVIATGGYARLMAKGLPEIKKVVPQLTLDGLRILASTKD